MDRNQKLFRFLPSSQVSRSRRHFMQQAGALGVSSFALASLLEACGGQASTTGASATPAANLTGPIDMQTLITNAKKEGKLEAIGFPPE